MQSLKFKAKKSLGQNFLVNPRVVEKIIEVSEIKGMRELIIEVGPGFGILTEALLSHAKKVIAIEKDERLFLSLRDRFSGRSNLELIHADALKITPPKEPYSLISNIPYSITSPLLDHYIRENPQNLPMRAVLLVQKEVAQKICAAPPRMNVLALHVQTFGKPRISGIVSRNNFRPVPKVDSAILRIDFHAPPNIDLKRYFDCIHIGFSHKRKMLRAVFDEKTLKKAGIEQTRRAETLSMEEWKIVSGNWKIVMVNRK